MEENVIYKKVGKRYVPFALGIDNESILTEGVWIVRRSPGSRSITNGDWLQTIYSLDKVGTVNHVDFAEIASMEEYADEVSKIMMADENKNITIHDLSRKIVKAMFNFNKKKENETI